jgi:hypothetical protein
MARRLPLTRRPGGILLRLLSSAGARGLLACGVLLAASDAAYRRFRAALMALSIRASCRSDLHAR